MTHAFAASTDWSNQHVDEALQITSKVLPIPAPVMKTALTRIQFAYITSQASKKEVVAFLTQMQKLYPEGLKQIPGAEFYAQ